MEIYETTDADFEKLTKFMELVDSEFYPPLSSRPGGIKGRIFNNLAREDANYLIAEVEGSVAGVIGYRKNWNGTKEAYISFIAVHPEYRRFGIAGSLDNTLMQKLSVDRISHVNITTWSTNPDVCKMYRQMGYHVFRILKDDRGPGVDTIYFNKAVKY
ncbi:MAG TPA: GNAT family N-acetyltransferase [Candidatus Nanoarchaeia archaeon]|nr:GNAT family N-acetyltransferase [Candidatus Nanoarchaeia archaeon]